ncbi:hypothetical protein SAMN06265375_101422 [Muriicola jejuensis]|uniref:Uncharacterized protein n=1 Tax=Muriicola jejuensis TaxID=504488 RepID=A0A6P0UIM5_9FLAO|nr:hypothetical protein [Muriicola jejuensis]NER10046.1 hypothetical protein [Muriicola jejuensis]SMP03441.1 hypothetical protein SAMN06265375_101422 [Muriicola jejuensis]
MSLKLDTYSFLPWVREGINNELQIDPLQDNLRARLQMPFKLKGSGIDGDKQETINQQISTYGPGDIVGINKSIIIKTEPHDWITNFEPNYLPCIDFYDEDFPWRYSPTKPDNEDRLQPWLALVVIEEGTFTEGKDLTDKPLSYFVLNEDVSPETLFQPAEQLWAWAHVHINEDLIKGETTNTEKIVAETNDLDKVLTEYKRVLSENPDMAYSRILCPVKLKENTAYHAFLIPSFESGRLAGLGISPEAQFYQAGTALRPTTTSWPSGEEIVYNTIISRVDSKSFPYYHRWYFRTGNAGDFEYLVRLLKPQPIDSRVGTRNMDCTNPGSNISGISDQELKPNGEKYSPLEGVLRLGGALRIPEEAIVDLETHQKYENWDQPYPRQFQRELASFINLADEYGKKITGQAHNNNNLPLSLRANPGDDPDPLITAPLYGRWHSLTQRLLDPTNPFPKNNWVHDLNLDPRHRVTAGFGTKVIQKNQEQYMEAAWQQVGDIIEANKRIRQAKLAEMASLVWHVKYLTPLVKVHPGTFMMLTQPMQARIVSKGLTLSGNEQTLTLKHQVKASKVPSVIFSPRIRAFTRPNSRGYKVLNYHASEAPADHLIDRINTGEIHPAPEKTTPKVQTIDDFAQAFQPENVPGILEWMAQKSWFKWLLLILVILILALIIGVVGSGASFTSTSIGTLAGALVVASGLILLFYRIQKVEKDKKAAQALEFNRQTPEAVSRLPRKPDFTLTVAGERISFKKGQTGARDSQEATRYKAALLESNRFLKTYQQAAIEPIKPKLNLDTIATATITALDPKKTIRDYVLKTQVKIPERLARERKKETFEEAWAYPEFDIPMYEHLLDISPDLFLPNINYVAQNSISLLETNQEFIEAYMVGLNHEFARELLWREYPSDNRGSYFRQFWDVSDFTYDQEDLQKFLTLAKSKLPADATSEDIEKQMTDEIRESLKDIPKLHLWSRYNNLGDHDHREAYRNAKLEQSKDHAEDKSEVVLVIRGELLKKYPNAVIYAHKAEWQMKDGKINTNEERQLVTLIESEMENPPRTKIKTPLYEAKVDPDIYFFGFDLDSKTAKGGSGKEGDTAAGWFFVIKERPGEPRFGLDMGTTQPSDIKVWNDLSWGTVIPEGSSDQHLNVDNFQTLTIQNLATGETEKQQQHEEDKQLTWSKQMNSAELAYVLYQSPVMIAVHAAEMLHTQKS